jgi:hypothetical protein
MKSPIILEDALRLIAEGTVDMRYPFRCAPREVLMERAKKALSDYEASDNPYLLSGDELAKTEKMRRN